MLQAANDYISRDFEHCVKTCKKLDSDDSKHREALFEANLHRFNSLAKEQIYLQQISKDDEQTTVSRGIYQRASTFMTSSTNKESYLLDALKSVKRSIKLFEQEANCYGIALAKF